MKGKTLAQSFTLLRLAMLPAGGARVLYRALADTNSLCREKLYMNLGYWRDDPASLDEAGEAMADLMARSAALSEADEILDVGFGFADQDIFWAEKYHPRLIRGVNVSREQAVIACDRVRARGLAEKILLEEGDATRLRFSDSSFDVVMAMESAFHFQTRENFFREAHRVLRVGGRLVLTDLAASSAKLALKDRLAQHIGRSFWQIPKENLYTADVYRRKLEDCGFWSVEVQSIWTDVYPRFVEYARRRLEEDDLARRMNPLYRRMLIASMKARKKLSQTAMDYLLVRAEKPL